MRRIHAIVLAAGFSRRMGMDKLSQDLCGKPVIQRCINQLLASGIERVYVVIRENEQSRTLVPNDRVSFIMNKEAASGMASSIRAAILHLEGDPEAVMIVNGDMPFFSVRNYTALVRLWEESDGGIASAYHMGEIRNPVIFSRRFFTDLLSVEGDRGAKAIVQKNQVYVKFLEILDPHYLMDIDTPEELDLARSMCNAFSGDLL